MISAITIQFDVFGGSEPSHQLFRNSLFESRRGIDGFIFQDILNLHLRSSRTLYIIQFLSFLTIFWVHYELCRAFTVIVKYIQFTASINIERTIQNNQLCKHILNVPIKCDKVLTTSIQNSIKLMHIINQIIAYHIHSLPMLFNKRLHRSKRALLGSMAS